MFGDRAERPTVDPTVATASLDCVRITDPEASVGHRGLSGAQRRRLLWPPGVAFDGVFRVFYTSRVICKGRLTMEEIIFSLKHYWRFVDSAALELQGLSWGTGRNM